MSWTISVKVWRSGQVVGEAQAVFDLGGPMSYGVHCAYVEPQIAFARATWDGASPGEKPPTVYRYDDGGDPASPTGQLKLYWLLRSNSANPSPTLSLDFTTKLITDVTPLIVCLSDVVPNGSNAIHTDPTLIVQSEMLFPFIHPAADIERALQPWRTS